MTARIIDGKSIAADLRAKITAEVTRLKSDKDLTPGLAVVLVGDNPASSIYVRTKSKRVHEVGMTSFDYQLPNSTSEEDLLKLIAELDADPAIHGMLVQLPLPEHIDAHNVISEIDPAKDVDGFHPVNVGRLATGLWSMPPCTPLGCVKLAKSVHGSLAGKHAVIVGRSSIVGRPLIQLLLSEHATVTVAHSRSDDLPDITRGADILFIAAGRPEMVRGNWVKPGATVIDVGINRVTSPERGTHIVGDVAFSEVVNIAGAMTPVPGGVGPMTIACLLLNTLSAACRSAGLPVPDFAR